MLLPAEIQPSLSIDMQFSHRVAPNSAHIQRYICTNSKVYPLAISGKVIPTDLWAKLFHYPMTESPHARNILCFTLTIFSMVIRIHKNVNTDHDRTTGGFVSKSSLIHRGQIRDVKGQRISWRSRDSRSLISKAVSRFGIQLATFNSGIIWTNLKKWVHSVETGIWVVGKWRNFMEPECPVYIAPLISEYTFHVKV